MSAREAFFRSAAPSEAGQVHPDKLADLLIRKSPRFEREIIDVRIYRGQPDSERDPRGFAASDRRCSEWRNEGLTVVTRQLQYPHEWPRERAREKGIDVEVAAWRPESRHARRLSVPGARLWCHWLDVNDHRLVADDRNYARAG